MQIKHCLVVKEGQQKQRDHGGSKGRCWARPFCSPSYELEKGGKKKTQSLCCKERGRLVSRLEASWGVRERLKRVSNRDTPVLTPQLFKRKK